MKKFLSRLAICLTLGLMTLSQTNMILADTGVGSDNLKPDLEVAQDPGILIRNVVTLVFIVAAALTFFYLIAGAIAWITSGGDKGKVEEARNKITAAVIGLLILAATWAIFILVMRVAFGEEDFVIPSLVDGGGSGGGGTVPRGGDCDRNRDCQSNICGGNKKCQ